MAGFSFFNDNLLAFRSMGNSLKIFIDKIGELQSDGDKYFPEGIFPAYRDNSHDWI